MQTRSPSNPSNRKRAESPDNSRNCATPSYSKDSSGHSPTSPAYSPSSPEPSLSGSKSFSKNSHQRYNPPVKKADPNRIARATALFGSLPIDPITGNPIPHKGRARSLGNRKIDTSFPPIKKRRGAVSKTVRPYSSKERKHKR